MGKIILILAFILSGLVAAQPVHILDDVEMVTHIKKGMDFTYNFEFENAQKEYAFLHEKYPAHPAYDFLMGLNAYWDILYNDAYKKYSSTMKTHLDRSLVLSDAICTQYPNDTEGVFFKLSTEAYFVLYYAERNMNSDAFSAARKAYYTLRKGKELKSKFNEFYFPSGMYDYFIIQYPENKPAFKPFTVFFMSGDKARGLKDLDYTFHNAIFTKMECGYHLSNIYLKYEDKPTVAYDYTKLLVKKFPQNVYFQIRHVEAAMAKGYYEEAKLHIAVLKNSGKTFFIASAKVLEGILAEKQLGDFVTAGKRYHEAIELFRLTSNPENDYLAFAYAGLGRVGVHNKNKVEADKWYKMAQAIAEYTSLIKECKRYFKTN